ncbi:MAG: PspC domain-containing protein [Pseudomonadales bacterium]|jgi:phage shock protein C|nr:PspC domain-containing protein [Pseudomonadales bacterium]
MSPRTDKRPLELDRENRKFLGVCAGLANYLDVEAWTVRLVFLGCLIFGAWFLAPLYFCAWFLLDESSSKARKTVAESHLMTHFKNVDYKKKLYRNTQDGWILGVCAGIADYLEVSVAAVRVAFILLVMFTGIPLLLYFCAPLVLDKKPLLLYYREAGYGDAEHHSARTKTSGSQARTEHEPRQARGQAYKRHEFQYCARKFANLQTRLARIEAYVTSSRFRLNRAFRDIS